MLRLPGLPWSPVLSPVVSWGYRVLLGLLWFLRVIVVSRGYCGLLSHLLGLLWSPLLSSAVSRGYRGLQGLSWSPWFAVVSRGYCGFPGLPWSPGVVLVSRGYYGLLSRLPGLQWSPGLLWSPGVTVVSLRSSGSVSVDLGVLMVVLMHPDADRSSSIISDRLGNGCCWLLTLQNSGSGCQAANSW